MFGRKVEFKRYLHEVSDAETGLLFIFKSGTHGSNEMLGRYKGRHGRIECILCGDKCEIKCCPCFMGESHLRTETL